MNKCPNCGTEYDGAFCPNGCNAPKICPTCGTQYTGNFCPKGCNSPANAHNKPKKGLKVWQIVLIVIGALVVIGIIGNIAGLNSSDSTANTTVGAKNESKITEIKTTTAQQTTTQIQTTVKSETKEEYIKSCKNVSYNELARNPDKYKGERIKFQINISQIMSGGWFTDGGYRGYEDYEMDFEDSNATFLKKEWYVSYKLPEGESKILEDDVIEFYGEYLGTQTVERALTNTKDEVPCIKAEYHKIVKAAE